VQELSMPIPTELKISDCLATGMPLDVSICAATAGIEK
jgi:hypothetical protein